VRSLEVEQLEMERSNFHEEFAMVFDEGREALGVVHEMQHIALLRDHFSALFKPPMMQIPKWSVFMHTGHHAVLS